MFYHMVFQLICTCYSQRLFGQMELVMPHVHMTLSSIGKLPTLSAGCTMKVQSRTLFWSTAGYS